MIEIRFDKVRGCGWRKPGGLYLVSGPGSVACGRFPIDLTVCPACSAGVKPSRGFTWIDPTVLFAGAECKLQGDRCRRCVHPADAAIVGNRAGLLWVGLEHYTADQFLAEAIELGISRRISRIPNDFELGRTFVFLASRAARFERCELASCEGELCDRCEGTGKIPIAGAIAMFRPEAIEYVVTGEETPEDLDRMIARGITPVKIERIDSPLFENEIRGLAN